MSDLRQRFYIEDSPVRGEVVHLEETLQTILAQRDYAPAVQVLLGEMLSATALLASTLKIKGRLDAVAIKYWLPSCCISYVAGEACLVVSDT
jgi:redox-regulated HSP33 family molecular chaperone